MPAHVDWLRKRRLTRLFPQASTEDHKHTDVPQNPQLTLREREGTAPLEPALPPLLFHSSLPDASTEDHVQKCHQTEHTAEIFSTGTKLFWAIVRLPTANAASVSWLRRRKGTAQLHIL